MNTKLSCAVLVALTLAGVLASNIVPSEPARSDATGVLGAARTSESDGDGVPRVLKGDQKPVVYPPVAPSVRSPIEGNLPVQRPWTEGDPVKVRPDLRRSGGEKK